MKVEKELPLLPQRRRTDFALRRSSQAKKPSSVLGTLFRGGASKAKHGNQREPPPTSSHSYSFVYTVLNPRSKQRPAVWFKIFITSVILWDCLLFIMMTDRRIYKKYPLLFLNSEAIVSWIFMIEYSLRLYTCTESKTYRDSGPLMGRLRYIVTLPALVDLFATLPYFAEYVVPFDLPTLTYLRVIRLGRILKTAGFVQAMDTVYRVIYYNREVLYVVLWLCIGLVLTTASLLYTLRPINNRTDEDNLDEFHSIPATLMLATLMLTGQGGPDSNDLPWYTQVVVLVTAIFSVAMFAIPASMLTWGFEAGALMSPSVHIFSFSPSIGYIILTLFFVSTEAERMAKRSRRRALKEREAVQRGDSYKSSTSEEDDDDDESTDTDEEYFKIIAGEEDDDDGNNDSNKTPEELARQQALRAAFAQADVNADGSLSLTEVSKLQSLLKADDSTRLLTGRMEAMETRVNDNTKKLDRILEILERK
jgi:voltage-gated potassium channel